MADRFFMRNFSGNLKSLTQLFILLTKITAAQNKAALSYHRVRRLDLLAVIFTATISIFMSSYVVSVASTVSNKLGDLTLLAMLPILKYSMSIIFCSGFDSENVFYSTR